MFCYYLWILKPIFMFSRICVQQRFVILSRSLVLYWHAESVLALLAASSCWSDCSQVSSSQQITCRREKKLGTTSSKQLKLEGDRYKSRKNLAVLSKKERQHIKSGTVAMILGEWLDSSSSPHDRQCRLPSSRIPRWRIQLWFRRFIAAPLMFIPP
jgi:hypothetical protein